MGMGRTENQAPVLLREVAPAQACTSASISRSAAKPSISRTRSASALFSISSSSAIFSSVIVVSVLRVQGSHLEP